MTRAVRVAVVVLTGVSGVAAFLLRLCHRTPRLLMLDELLPQTVADPPAGAE